MRISYLSTYGFGSFFRSPFLRNSARLSAIIAVFMLCLQGGAGYAQGTWVKVNTPAFDPNGGVMVLLPDGSVICKTTVGGPDMYGNVWDKLTPDAHGSYENGTWSVINSMADSRLYFSSQVMKDGRVYIAGGEYGTGKYKAEVYDPVADVWTPTALLPLGDTVYDDNSVMLPDGRVLQGSILETSSTIGKGTLIYDPATNAFTLGPSTLRNHYEVSWVKLPDNSVLFVDWRDTTSERYIPATNSVIVDDTVPVNIYDSIAYETGPAVLLPDGRAFVIGGNGKTAFYTPSGTTAHGTWAAGPSLPNAQGAPDAAASVMPNGKLLCATSPIPYGTMYFPTPISFYEFDYTTNSFTRIYGPNGVITMDGPCFFTHMLNLPDGNILFSTYDNSQYYIYKPGGTPLAAGKPTVDHVYRINCDTFKATGRMFNGLNEGSYYGDDWQMSTNYPLVRLTSGTNVYYTRTYNWNRTGVMTGSLPDTTYFILPAGLPDDTYTMELVVNGIPSAGRTFKTCAAAGIEEQEIAAGQLLIHPNPATDKAELTFVAETQGAYTVRLQDVLGRTLLQASGYASVGVNTNQLNLSGLSHGVYTVVVNEGGKVYVDKLLIE